MRYNDICAGIVTYNPEIFRLQENINSIKNQVSKIIIVDNGSKNYNELEKCISECHVNYEIINNKKNLGIAKALNQLCEKATEDNYKWIITLDQDSVSSNNLVEKLAKNINNEVAIISPNIVYRNNEKFNLRKKGAEYVEWVITSASLTNLNVWKKIKFDEKLFIDGVDRDYCIRANRLGYKIIKDYNVELIHELGNLKCKKMFRRTIYVTNHSAIRKYYMVRNVIYLDKKLNENRRFCYIGKNIIKTICFEQNKAPKLKSIFKGIKDGIYMKRGIK
mgnify:CR=1 FL=1